MPNNLYQHIFDSVTALRVTLMKLEEVKYFVLSEGVFWSED